MANEQVEKSEILPEYGPVTKADLRKAAWRHNLTLQWSWNYERMQALGYMWSILPILQRVSKTKEELIANMQRHMVFYNTNPAVGSPIIFGATCALEEKGQGEVGDSLKVALMGPFAGIGDTIQAILLRPMVAVLAASLAMEGSMAGPLIMFIFGLCWFALKFPQFYWGYNQGVNLVTTVAGGALDKITEGATIMGLIVVGGFVPSIMAKVTTPIKFVKQVTVEGEMAEKVIELQPALDAILPYMIPLLIVAFAYWLLKGRKQSPIKVLLWLTVLAFVCSYLGIL
ncbi:MAG: PTS system mannose/fructose/sorbose family transporter subunit IID [Symbiobacterium sp.]|uniref:PTS system mannose/fructose/sorbose family transporter subunit IID n=1 Tax=Symbiobacterium sp. TaxID=1971213 RepID=UPI0034641F61